MTTNEGTIANIRIRVRALVQSTFLDVDNACLEAFIEEEIEPLARAAREAGVSQADISTAIEAALADQGLESPEHQQRRGRS